MMTLKHWMERSNKCVPLLMTNGGIAGLIQPNHDKPYNLNSDIQIEMYYSGIPFVSNVLKNVCTICRIPYYTQTIY